MTLLVAHEGRLSRVLFDPSPELRLQTDGSVCRIHASRQQAEKALELQGQDVVVYAGKTKTGLSMVEIHAAKDLPRKPDQEARMEHMLTKWGPLLARLAQ